MEHMEPRESGKRRISDLSPIERLKISITSAKNSGMTEDEIIGIVHDVFDKGNARTDKTVPEELRQYSRPDRNGKGYERIAKEADFSAPSVSTPKPNPPRKKRGLKAVYKETLFDVYKLPGDVRAVGDITWKELQGLARKHAEAFRLLSLIDGYGVPTDPDAKVRDVLKEDTLREFIEIARLSNVH